MNFNQNGRRQESVPPSFHLQWLENYRESKLKVFMLFRTFLKLSYEKARNFCSQIYIWKYFPYSNYTENQVHTSSRWLNYWRFCPDVCLLLLKIGTQCARASTESPMMEIWLEILIELGLATNIRIFFEMFRSSWDI